jgi:putative transposase
MKRFFSIQELVSIQKIIQNTNYPTTRQAFEYRAKNEAWPFREEKSTGRNGSRRVYQVPEQLSLIILNHELIQKQAALPAIVEASQPLIVATTHSAAELADWQRTCAESRLILVREVAARVRNGVRKTAAIEALVAEAEACALPPHLQETVIAANAKSGDSRAVSRRTLISWITLAEDAEKNQMSAIAALAPKPRMVRIPEWAAILLKLWGQPQKPNLTTVLELLPEHLPEGVDCPSYSQAWRFLSEKMGNVDVQKGRMGNRALKNIQPFIRRDSSELLPTDCYTADGHCFDAEIAHPRHGKPFRPEITSIIDVATRKIVGYSIDLAESGWAVLDAIRMSACESGVPAIFYVDNGSGYSNSLMKAEGRGLMARLGCEMTHALPYNSQAKGAIERSHKSLWVKAAKKLPTYIGKDMDDEARQRTFKITRADVAKTGTSRLLMSWPEFLLFAAEIVAEYNQKPHSALSKIADPQTMRRRHLSPVEAWEAGAAQADIQIVEAWDAEDLFRPYELRQVRRGEIELFSNRYFSDELEQYHGEMVNVSFDIHNPEQVWVRDSEGRLICTAKWNANRTSYFPKSRVEQARENRAKGRMRRIAVKQSEIMQELSPQQVIEHIQQETVPLPMQKDHEKLLADLHARRDETIAQAEIVSFPTRTVKPLAVHETEDVPANSELVKLARWMKLDDEFINNGDIENQEDARFWRLFQLSKQFKSLCNTSEELKRRLETTQFVNRG